jgi:NTE family protein
VEFVRIDNLSPYSEELLRSYIDIPVGEPLDTARIEEDVLRVYSLGTLSSVTWEVVQEDGKTGVLVRARPKPHGPNYLQLGMTLSADFDGKFESNLIAGILFSPLTPTGMEGRIKAAIGSEPGLEGEIYVPFGDRGRNIFFTSLGVANPGIALFDDDGLQVAKYDVYLSRLEARLGREFGNHGLAAFGISRTTGEASVEIGDPGLPDIDEFDEGRLYLLGTLDRIDSLSFPRDGYFAQIAYSASYDWLGSDSEFKQFDFDAIYAGEFGRHSLMFGARYHSTVSGIAPIQSVYRLGGRTRLAGYRYNELTGQHYALVATGYSYQLAAFLGRPALVGGTLEYGNAWLLRDDIGEDAEVNASLYAGFDSWIGPMLFGFGWREDGNGIFFMEIGRPF